MPCQICHSRGAPAGRPLMRPGVQAYRMSRSDLGETMRHALLPLVAVAAIAAASASAQAPSPAAGKGWAGELWPRGGGAESSSGGTTGAGFLDGAASYSFDNGITGRAEAQGNALLGRDGAGGKAQAWWQDPRLGLIGGFAEASRSNGLWQRRYVAQGELYLGPFTLRSQAGFVPTDRQGNTELQGGFFGLASGGWYPLDALGLNLGAATQSGRGLAFGNVEWAPEFMPPGSSFTLDGGAGPNGFLLGLVGVRFVFGPGAGGSVRGRQVGTAPGFPAYVVGAFGERNRPDPPPPRGQ
jgi:hypothetical protein